MFNNVQHQGWETDQKTDTAVMWKIHEDSPFNHVPDREEALHLCANFLSLGSFGEEEEGGRLRSGHDPKAEAFGSCVRNMRSQR